eukprot:Colp12_sorted_trinity150504_noHs@9824
MSDQTAPNTAEVASEKPETQEVVVESDSAEKNADSGVDDASSSQRGRQERRRNGRANRGRGGPQQQQTAPRQAQYPQHQQQAYGQQPYRNYFPQGVPRGAQPQFRPQFNGQRYQYVQDPRGAGPLFRMIQPSPKPQFSPLFRTHSNLWFSEVKIGLCRLKLKFKKQKDKTGMVTTVYPARYVLEWNAYDNKALHHSKKKKKKSTLR